MQFLLFIEPYVTFLISEFLLVIQTALIASFKLENTSNCLLKAKLKGSNKCYFFRFRTFFIIA